MVRDSTPAPASRPNPARITTTPHGLEANPNASANTPQKNTSGMNTRRRPNLSARGASDVRRPVFYPHSGAANASVTISVDSWHQRLPPTHRHRRPDADRRLWHAKVPHHLVDVREDDRKDDALVSAGSTPPTSETRATQSGKILTTGTGVATRGRKYAGLLSGWPFGVVGVVEYRLPVADAGVSSASPLSRLAPVGNRCVSCRSSDSRLPVDERRLAGFAGFRGADIAMGWEMGKVRWEMQE